NKMSCALGFFYIDLVLSREKQSTEEKETSALFLMRKTKRQNYGRHGSRNRVNRVGQGTFPTAPWRHCPSLRLSVLSTQCTSAETQRERRERRTAVFLPFAY